MNNYPKAIWAEKCNSVLTRENEDDEVEVCEEMSLHILLILFDVYKLIESNWICLRLSVCNPIGSEGISPLMYSTYQVLHGKFQDRIDNSKNILRNELSASISKLVCLIIEDSIVCLNKQGAVELRKWHAEVQGVWRAFILCKGKILLKN